MTRPDVEIFESAGVLVLWLVVSLFFSAYCTCVLAGIAPVPEHGEWAMYAGAVLFPLISVALVIRIAQSRNPVVVLSEAGIKYRLLSSEIIPWTAVLGVEEAQGEDAKGARLKLDPEFARQVPRRGMAGVFSQAGVAHVIDVSAIGIGGDELFRLVHAWWDSRRDKRDSQ